MNEETAGAAPSAVESPSLEIPSSGSPEYAEWRMSGNLPEKKVQPKADPAPADPSKETRSETNVPDPEPGKPRQEKRRRPDVEQRFKSLTDELNSVKAQLEEARRGKPTPAESSPAKPAPPPQYARTKPTADDKKPDGTPKYGTYEDFVEDLADWKAEQRWMAAQREQAFQAQQRELDAKVNDARTRYGDKFDSVLNPAVNSIVKAAPPGTAVHAMLNDSTVLPDLIFTIGSDPKTLNEFVAMTKTNPGKALRYIAVLENGIIEELSKGAATRNEKGEFAAKPEAPAKRGPESTPDPPLDIGQRGGGSMNESQRALQALERGDSNAFRSWKQAEDRKALARRRGA